MRSFDRTIVVCTGSTCARHTGGLYWPTDITQKLYVFDTKHIDQLVADHSTDIAQLLGLGSPTEADPLVLPRVSLDLKHSVYDESGDSGTIDPNSGMRVRNPLKPKKGKGRITQKRKMGARG